MVSTPRGVAGKSVSRSRHSERSEESLDFFQIEMLRFVQHDTVRDSSILFNS